MAELHKISPCLWFDGNGRKAAEYYCSLFSNSKILSDSGMVVEFELEGIKFTALNGGPNFKFTEAISFMIYCKDQEEVDHFWDHFVNDGGSESMCGWCKDKFGLSWQVIPVRLMEIMKSGDQEKSKKAFDAMLKMKKLVISDLEDAYNS